MTPGGPADNDNNLSKMHDPKSRLVRMKLVRIRHKRLSQQEHNQLNYCTPAHDLPLYIWTLIVCYFIRNSSHFVFFFNLIPMSIHSDHGFHGYNSIQTDCKICFVWKNLRGSISQGTALHLCLLFFLYLLWRSRIGTRLAWRRCPEGQRSVQNTFVFEQKCSNHWKHHVTYIHTSCTYDE